MDDAQFSALCEKIAGDFIEVYSEWCDKASTRTVLTAMIGALAACATDAGTTAIQTIAGLSSAFDDIEAGGAT